MPEKPSGSSNMRKFAKAFVRNERGISSMEYAILASIVVVSLGAVTTTFSTNIHNWVSALLPIFTSATNNAR
jgi:pilus assembly protein Flp/PilA